MRRSARILGNLLLILSLTGAVALSGTVLLHTLARAEVVQPLAADGVGLPIDMQAAPAPSMPRADVEPALTRAAPATVVTEVPGLLPIGRPTPELAVHLASVPTPVAAPPSRPAPAPSPTPAPFLPITHLRIPDVPLDTEVVLAPWTDTDSGPTWTVPPFVAGHAERTAGAGQSGNAVLFGHVTSRSLGNVFQDLHRVHQGALMEVSSGSHQFTYRVTGVWTVPRTEVEVLAQTDTSTLTLVTCAGLWNPVLWDYMERLVVRAELVTDFHSRFRPD